MSSQCIKAMNTAVSPLLGKSHHCWVSFGGGEHQSLQHCHFYHHAPFFHPPHGSVSSVETKVDALWRWFGTPAVHNTYLSIKAFSGLVLQGMLFPMRCFYILGKGVSWRFIRHLAY